MPQQIAILSVSCFGYAWASAFSETLWLIMDAQNQNNNNIHNLVCMNIVITHGDMSLLLHSPR